MNIGDFLKKLNEDDDRRATALAALKQILSYVGVDGRTRVPGDGDYDASRATFANRTLALELHNALTTNNTDGLNALLDRWYSANLVYQPADDAGGGAGKTGGLRQIRAAVDGLTEAFSRLVESQPISSVNQLVEKLDRPRPVGAADSRGLLR